MNEPDPDVINQIKDIQRMLGRNILTFQNIEHILKLIHQFRNGSGTFKNLLKRKDKIDELSLGRLTDVSVLNKIDSKLNSKNGKESFLSYNLLPDDKALISAIKVLNDMNDDRNFLVHNFTQKWKFKDIATCEEAKSWLENQYQCIFEQRKILLNVLELIKQRTLEYDAFINSDDGKKIFDEIDATENKEGYTLEISFETTSY